MIKKLFGRPLTRFLRRRGFRLVRVPSTQVRPHSDPEKRDWEAAREIIFAYVREHPDVWPDMQAAGDYSTLGRNSNYLEAIDLLVDNGISLENKTLLEVGAMFGQFLRNVRNRCPSTELCGAENDAKPAAIARLVCPEATITGDTLETLDPSAQYDIVVMMQVLEHLADPWSALEKLLAITKPGGCVLITIPDGRLDTFRAKKYLPERHSYTGHINFWSVESWQYFLQREIPGAEISTGTTGNGNLYGVIKPAVSANTPA